MQKQTPETRRWNSTSDHTRRGFSLRITKTKISTTDSRNVHRKALIVHDGYSYWLQSCPSDSKDAHERAACLRRFLPPFQKPRRFFTGNAKEFLKACQDRHWTHDTNTPHRSETNGIAERAVQWRKETATAMLQRSRQTACEKFCGVRFDGPLIPFGAKATNPSLRKTRQGWINSAKKMLLGMCMGYV